jgi:hypothetical protein
VKYSKQTLPRSVKRLFPNVTEVVDSDVSADVLVTRKDCGKEARRKAPDECAMARALKRQYKADGAVIGISRSYLIRGDKAVRFLTPASFDRHHDFAPGAYKLSAVPSVQRLGKPDNRRDRHHSGPKRQSRVVHQRTVRVRALGR